jgi:sigma-54 dependent transcriptional regulator, acetoin dehydrogenase operon transcriptional activator AcoR
VIDDDRDAMALRPEIVSSWRRTASAGLDPGATVDPEDVADYDPGSRLRRAAAPVLDAVAEHLAGTRYGVVLADPDSCIVDARFGQSEFEARLAALGAVPGKTFTEATTGTNSIATAGETQRGVAVHGEEHYLEVFKRFACFGAPIRDPITRRHAGVPDITCFAEDGAPLLRPFLLRAVDDIETSLLETARHSHRRVLAAFEAARPRARALVAFGPDIVLANDAAAGDARSERPHHVADALRG